MSDTGTGSGEAPRKSLEDIRLELDTEYPSSTADDRLAEPEIPVEPPRPAPRRGAARRGHVMAAAIGCIAGQVLLVVAYVAVTRYAGDVIWLRAPANAPGLAAPLSPADDTTALPAAALGPAPAPHVDPQLEALRTDLRSLAAKLERAESRVAGAESRISGVESQVHGVESSMRRLGDDVASAADRTRRVERALSASRQTAAKPAPPAPLPPAPAPATATERGISSEHVAPPSPPPPHQVRPPAEALAPPALSSPPQPQRESSLSPETKAPTTDSAPSRAASAPSDNASSSSTPPTLRDKLRDDWRSIKEGFASAGDDFKATMRDLARRVRGE
jgi:hypothetical protein